ncbi:hypothetical protein [Brucella rhizosphaerae]|nr:hypothetical protein [Brucella rhizosphaerae]
MAIGTCWEFSFEILSIANGDGFTDINGKRNEIFLRPLMIEPDVNELGSEMPVILTRRLLIGGHKTGIHPAPKQHHIFSEYMSQPTLA